MPVDVIMPQMGESIFEGTITKWLKAVGDAVERDEPLFEISTDKVDAEVPSPTAGVLQEIRFSEGSTVQVNSVVAVIGDSAAVPASAHIAPIEPPADSSAPPESGADMPANVATFVSGNRQVRYSPLVRRIARDNDVDLDRIQGTGLEGRVTKDDVLRYIKEQKTAGDRAATQPIPKAPVSALPPEPAAATVAPSPSASRTEITPSPVPAVPGELVPLTKMRAIIAQRTAESAQTAPHVHTVFKVDMTRIVRLREHEKAQFGQRNGIKLTYMPFIAVAAVETLRKFPIINASLEKSSIRYHRNINLGIAVALEWGLIVPVIKQAEERNFLGLARAIADLAERARGKRLNPDEASGSTFTLTNSGIFGEEFGTPIINQPGSAILAIGGLKKDPVVITDTHGNDSIAIRSVQHFSLGFDHRIIDGADAGRFMNEFKKTLENWNQDIG